MFSFLLSIVILPAVHLILIWFIVNLVRGSRGAQHRIQMMIGVFAGFLLCVIFVILDQTTDMFNQINSLPDPSRITQVLPFVAGAFVFGLALMFLTHALFKTQSAQAAIVLFMTFLVATSAYFLLTISRIRSVAATSSIGFIAGVFIYLMFATELVPPLLGIALRQPNQPNKSPW